MRRRVLHITSALLTFTAGFLSADSSHKLTYALPAALAVFILLSLSERIRGTGYDFHYFKVAAITLVLWAAAAYAILTVFLPPSGLSNCVPDFTVEETEALRAAGEDVMFTAPPETASDDYLNAGSRSCGGGMAEMPKVNLHFGVLNMKAISKPAPVYPPLAKAACAKGTVTVTVVVDVTTGEVIWSQAVSGHPLLRQAAREVACHARFAPIFTSGLPIRVSGLLTYNFIH